MQGVPMTQPRRLDSVRRGSSIRVAIGPWASGLYFVRLRSDDKVGYAPFFVRPQRLGENRVAVVLPTRTWQAYNFRSADTWYSDGHDNTVVLGRPFLNRGVPFRFRAYDLYFLNWLHRTGKRVDILAQSELEIARDPGALRRAYDLIVFPGHHEYVTQAEYDAVESFRDRGGKLAFLSANNFFWRVDIQGNVMTRVRKWRELGRPEAALIGVQYIGNDDGEARGAWVVEAGQRRSWLFDGITLRDGTRFSNGGIEIDKTSAASPPGTRVVAQISEPARARHDRADGVLPNCTRARRCSPPARSRWPERFASRRWRAWSRTCGSALPGSNPAPKAPGGGNARRLKLAPPLRRDGSTTSS